MDTSIVIFNYLDKACEPNHTPVPHNIFDYPLEFESYGILISLISRAFETMRATQGTSAWECDAKPLMDTKISVNEMMTFERLSECLDELEEHNLIEYWHETPDALTVKVNAVVLYPDLLKETRT